MRTLIPFLGLFIAMHLNGQQNLFYLNLNDPTKPTANVFASSTLSGYENLVGPTKAIDKDPSSTWVSGTYVSNASLTIDLKVTCLIDSLRIIWMGGQTGTVGKISLQNGLSNTSVSSYSFLDNTTQIQQKFIITKNANKILINFDLLTSSFSAQVFEVYAFGKVIDTANTFSTLKVTGKSTFMGEMNASNIISDTITGTIIKGSYFYGNGSALTGINGFNYWTKNNNHLLYQLGNIGIGTEIPTSKLHVKNGSLTIEGTTESWTSSGWQTSFKTPYVTSWVTNQKNDSMQYMGIGMKRDGWYFMTSKSQPGNTDNPARYPFFVTLSGKVIAREIEVNLTDWPDHVFKTGYTLRPLSEVETFIKANKHLPDVPSETEVVSKGVNLGQMDAILHRKIEELTLYMIELKKENEELRNTINEINR